VTDRVGTVYVEGLDEFRRELKKAERALPKAMNDLNNRVATIAKDAGQQQATAMGSVFRKVAPSFSAGRAASKAAVLLGGQRYPMAIGAEFGARRYRQFPAWRGNQYADPLGTDVGYMLHPAIRANRDRIINTYGDGIEKLMSTAFPS
jgi:hypothetical protein